MRTFALAINNENEAFFLCAFVSAAFVPVIFEGGFGLKCLG